MTRGGYPFEENSIGLGALRFGSDDSTSGNYFRQQLNRQFNRDRPDSTGGRLAAAAATADSADFGNCDSEYAGGRRMATASTTANSAEFECPGQWVASLRVF